VEQARIGDRRFIRRGDAAIEHQRAGRRRQAVVGAVEDQHRERDRGHCLREIIDRAGKFIERAGG
jgi:hypothetical protein